MNRDELGRLSTDELVIDRHTDKECQAEYYERRDAHLRGKPGSTALLSRAQVVATLKPLLVNVSTHAEQCGCGFCVRNDAIHHAAKTLLALGDDAQSPLEGDDNG